MRLMLASTGIAIALCAGTTPAQTTIDEIIARVNADIILRSEYEELSASMHEELAEQLQGVQLEQALEEGDKNLLRGLIDNHLLTQKAKSLDMTADLEVIKTMERLRQEYEFETLESLESAIIQQGQDLATFKQNISTQYLSQQVLQREVYPKIIITTEDLRNYYEDNQLEFDRPEGIQIQEIAFVTEGKTPEAMEAIEKKAQAALDRVRSGEDFGEVANEVSEVSTASSFGELGFFEKGQLSEEYEKVTSSLGRDEISDIISLSDVLVILKVQDRHTGGILAFDLARSDLQNRIWGMRVEPRIREYLSRLRLEGFVEVREGYTDSGAVGSTLRQQ